MSRKADLDRYEWYPTPGACTRELRRHYLISDLCVEPCVGDGSIIRGFTGRVDSQLPWDTEWITNDLDPDWPADFHGDACLPDFYTQVVQDYGPINWVITNPAFSITTKLLAALLPLWDTDHIYNLALYTRVTYNEVLKRDAVKLALFQAHPPNGIIFLPRVSHRRNVKEEWGSDSAACCWLVWNSDDLVERRQSIAYAGAECLKELDREKGDFRDLVDYYVEGGAPK